LIVVTGTTGHLGRLMMERLLIRAIACGQCVVRAGPNRGRCLEECSII
jgi:thioester reductase-like protein